MSKFNPLELLTGGGNHGQPEAGVNTMDLVKGGAAIAALGFEYGMGGTGNEFVDNGIKGAALGQLAGSAVKSLGGGTGLQAAAGALVGGVATGSLEGAAAGGLTGATMSADYSQEFKAAGDMVSNFFGGSGTSQPGSSGALPSAAPQFSMPSAQPAMANAM